MGGRVVEGARLERVYTVKAVSRVRIPPHPPFALGRDFSTSRGHCPRARGSRGPVGSNRTSEARHVAVLRVKSFSGRPLFSELSALAGFGTDHLWSTVPMVNDASKRGAFDSRPLTQPEPGLNTELRWLGPAPSFSSLGTAPMEFARCPQAGEVSNKPNPRWAVQLLAAACSITVITKLAGATGFDAIALFASVGLALRQPR